jgi:hypothetical protein
MKKKVKSNPWKAEKKGNNVHVISFDAPGHKWEQWVLLQSDEHWDNPHCDRALLKRHHEQAMERNAPILKFGDVFCGMQGKYDRRSDKSALRPEHKHGEYLDRLVETAAEWYAPYSQNIALLGLGNHETSLLARHETNILDRLAAELRHRGGITTTGGYSGWVRFMFRLNTRRYSRRLYYHHGAGMDPAVTKGSIEFARMPEKCSADIYVAGHIHQRTVQDGMRVHLNEANVVEQRQVWSIRTGTYKDEYQDGAYGWHVEKGRGARPLGGWWLRWTLRDGVGPLCDVIPTDR